MKYILFLLLFLFLSCNPSSTKEFRIQSIDTLTGIPSGSGISIVLHKTYVISDDSAFLYKLNKTNDIEDTIQLLADFTYPSNKRIPKAIKPDYEAMCSINEEQLLVFGSGSVSPSRDILTLIHLADSISIKNYSTTSFFDHLHQLEEFSNTEINIEGAAFTKDSLFLANRANNTIIQVHYPSLLSYLEDNTPIPAIKITQLKLPMIKGKQAGLSGLTSTKNKNQFLFTASVENTDNAYDDGEILGSFIGQWENNSNRIVYKKINSDEPLKVEAISIKENISSTHYDVVLVTDDDKGNSLLIKGDVIF